MLKWFRILKAITENIYEYPPRTPKPDKKSIIITDQIIGFNEPTLCILEIEVSAACRNCGTQWKQKLTNVYAVKNGIYMYDHCSKCIDMTNAVKRMMKYHKTKADSDG